MLPALSVVWYTICMDNQSTAVSPPSSPLWRWASSPGQVAPPPYDLITEDQFVPAFSAAMAIQRAEVDAIVGDPSTPTFLNTLEALEKSGRAYDRLSGILNIYVANQLTDELTNINEILSAQRCAHQDVITFDAGLFARISTVNEHEKSALSSESARLLDEVYQGFVMAGAKLATTEQAILSDINAKLELLSVRYEQALLADRKNGALWLDSASDLDGLDADAVRAARDSAIANGRPGHFRIELKNTTQHPYLASLKDRSVRRRLLEASMNRANLNVGEDSSSSIATEIAALRAAHAALLGSQTHAHHVLRDQMARNPETVMDMIKRLATPIMAAVERESAVLQSAADADADATGCPRFVLAPWDWAYYDRVVRERETGLDVTQLRQYMTLDRVLEKGVFASMKALYGIRFEPVAVPLLNHDMRAWEVFEDTGKSLGLCYLDAFCSPIKQGGAWMEPLVQGTGLFNEHSLAWVSMNLDKPDAGQALLDMDDVTTVFHEFGHAVHVLFSAARYPTVAGTNTATDFVELPSMLNEYWARDRVTIGYYARHHSTGAALPDGVYSRILATDKFHRGFDQLEYLASASIDLAWHSLTQAAPQPLNHAAFEQAALQAAGVAHPLVPPRYLTAYFSHAFSGGYDASYYAYAWSGVLAADAAACMRDRGGMTRANGQAFRDQVLAMGNTLDPATLYRAWRGADPDPAHFLHDTGLDVQYQKPSLQRTRPAP